MKYRGSGIIVSEIIVGFLILSASLGVYTWKHYSPAGAVYPGKDLAYIELDYPLRNGAQHDVAKEHNGGEPYILSFDTKNGGSLFYYGASHTLDGNHPQIADITSNWKRFNPTVALYEGRSRGYFYGALIEPFAGLPEPALVHKLARRGGIPLYGLEPPYTDEVGELLNSFSAEQVALYFFLRVYSSEAGGQPRESLALQLLGKRTDVYGLKGSIKDIADLDHIWQRDFPDQSDWRIQLGEPGYLKDISNRSQQIRGEYMARLLIGLVNRGERVFAVVGSGHVIRQEWNLRSALNQEPAWDQPPITTDMEPTPTQ